jgi:transcription elongation factor Elf1
VAKKLTKKQKQEYLRAGGSHCPFCGSEDITGQSPDYDGGISQVVACNVCDGRWVDIYNLVEVIDAD